MEKPRQEGGLRSAVIEAEEALLDAIEVYSVGRGDAMQQGVSRVRDEEAHFPSKLVSQARRLREIIYSHEGLGEDYLAGIEETEDKSGETATRDMYMAAQEDLLGSIEDYSDLLWMGAYAEVTEKAQVLRLALKAREGLDESYLGKRERLIDG